PHPHRTKRQRGRARNTATPVTKSIVTVRSSAPTFAVSKAIGWTSALPGVGSTVCGWITGGASPGQGVKPTDASCLEPLVPVAAGISILCALALLTGWLVLRGAPFALAIPANAAFVTASVALLIHRPRGSR